MRHAQIARATVTENDMHHAERLEAGAIVAWFTNCRRDALNFVFKIEERIP
jgi:hypothetical protein